MNYFSCQFLLQYHFRLREICKTISRTSISHLSQFINYLFCPNYFMILFLSSVDTLFFFLNCLRQSWRHCFLLAPQYCNMFSKEQRHSNYSKMIKATKLNSHMLQLCNQQFIFKFCKLIQERPLKLFFPQSRYHLASHSAMDLCSVLLFIDSDIIKGTNQLFCKIFFSLGLSNISSPFMNHCLVVIKGLG